MLVGLALELSPLDDQVVNAIARVLRAVRLVRLLRAAALVRATRRLLRTLLLCASNLLNTTLLLILLIFIYAVRIVQCTPYAQISLALAFAKHCPYSRRDRSQWKMTQNRLIYLIRVYSI